MKLAVGQYQTLRKTKDIIKNITKDSSNRIVGAYGL